ncbi:hypothetical protein CYMTET_50792 [Cymbomonas tetramitiformis]|uniref:Uncharacterized protein n=1 Tax=Cymbomonas tetramitiformis TaxID=36881 RepID=A0AAE0ESG1_9CHLO|nr:hypothetical protein CYMTET_50792 [Cymbomonas tetramitiformis]
MEVVYHQNGGACVTSALPGVPCINISQHPKSVPSINLSQYPTRNTFCNASTNPIWLKFGGKNEEAVTTPRAPFRDPSEG